MLLLTSSILSLLLYASMAVAVVCPLYSAADDGRAARIEPYSEEIVCHYPFHFYDQTYEKKCYYYPQSNGQVCSPF